jgi:hypothetical protein
MVGQVTPSSTQSWILDDTIWEGSGRRSNDAATHPDNTQYSRIFGVSFTNAKMSDSVDRLDAQSSCPDAVLFWEEYHFSGKAVVEDRSDAAK